MPVNQTGVGELPVCREHLVGGLRVHAASGLIRSPLSPTMTMPSPLTGGDAVVVVGICVVVVVGAIVVVVVVGGTNVVDVVGSTRSPTSWSSGRPGRRSHSR